MKHVWRRFLSSLRARLLILFLLLAIVPLAIVTYLVFDSGRESIVNNVEAHLESVAILKQQEVDLWVKHAGHAVTWLSTSPQIGRAAAALTNQTTDDLAPLLAERLRNRRQSQGGSV